MKKFMIKSLAVLTIGGLVFTGCQKGNDANTDTSSKTTNEKTTMEENKEALEKSDDGKMEVDTSTKPSPEAPANLKLAEAYNVYQEKHPESSLKEMSLEEDDNLFVYKFQGRKNNEEYELKLNAEDLSVIKDETDTDNDDDDDLLFNFSEMSEVEEYVKNVLSENDGYSLDEWKVEEDDNQFVLKVEIRKDGDKVEYKIDPKNGNVIEKK